MGLNELKWSYALEKLADQWAEYLIQAGEFEHSKPPPGRSWGENLYLLRFSTVRSAILFYPYTPSEHEIAEKCVEAWKSSPGHDRNMREPLWNYVGVGVAVKIDYYTPGIKVVTVIIVAQFSDRP